MRAATLLVLQQQLSFTVALQQCKPAMCATCIGTYGHTLLMPRKSQDVRVATFECMAVACVHLFACYILRRQLVLGPAFSPCVQNKF